MTSQSANFIFWKGNDGLFWLPGQRHRLLLENTINVNSTYHGTFKCLYLHLSLRPSLHMCPLSSPSSTHSIHTSSLPALLSPSSSAWGDFCLLTAYLMFHALWFPPRHFYKPMSRGEEKESLTEDGREDTARKTSWQNWERLVLMTETDYYSITPGLWPRTYLQPGDQLSRLLSAKYSCWNSITFHF